MYRRLLRTIPEVQVHDSLTTELVGRPSVKLPSYTIADDPLVQVWILHHKGVLP